MEGRDQSGKWTIEKKRDIGDKNLNELREDEEKAASAAWAADTARTSIRARLAKVRKEEIYIRYVSLSIATFHSAIDH